LLSKFWRAASGDLAILRSCDAWSFKRLRTADTTGLLAGMIACERTK
jgi:hypothetical protein